MKIHELNVSPKASGKRVGRGIGSGKGKTSGRGTKGQNSRSGGGVRPGFEGGQNPLAKRLPKKRGFSSLNPVTYQVVSLTRLETFKAGQTVTNVTLTEAGFLKRSSLAAKVVGTGQLSKKLDIQLQATSKSALAAIKAAGGSFTATQLLPTPKKPSRPVKES